MDRAESQIPPTYHGLVRDAFGGTVRETNSHYPSRLSVRFDWEAIQAFDDSIAREFLQAPSRAREHVEEAIACWDAVDMPEAVVRVHNIPDDHHFRVGKQRTIHLGTLVTIEGEIVEMDGVQPFAETAALECHTCGTLHHQPQTYGRMMEPAECMECERKGTMWIFRREHSELIDYRKVVLQRADTNLDDDPPTLVVYLTQDLVDRVGPGDYVSLVGYYDTGLIQKDSVLNTFLDTWDIESHEAGVLADRLSPDELADELLAEIEALQDQDSSSFGADREAVIETITDEGVRRTEVEEQLETLIDAGDVNDVGGDKLMVT